ncbi:MAG: DUF5522 domain-containing protein [Planctomycetota bacterium]
MSNPEAKTACELGTDYYVERGSVVFTAAFLARRGWCCGNGCRHCPYEGDEKRDRAIEARQRA